ncbi:MAG: hypothetical protein AVDCRST_MAG49-4562 [uncultured Thermomicrobiales bacterium]|jgi:hypothetical protein|uniref:Uncharacterized protein n=1 Tax=uncultured Thermomicrobiales bacterium TaxID=1645740 RepID=A0A6J4VHS8_9BACT|nr:MAG: hypothetical protein AVDCRST_MAG49-4562 [uncultured Thermomicrobiales bacterium]
MSVAMLEALRPRVLPMLRLVAEEYGGRMPEGYPLVVDTVEQGAIGLEIDSSYALYLVSDGDELFVDMYRRVPRNDARSSGSRMRHGGAPFHDRRPISPTISDQAIRNLIAELMSHYNFAPGIIHITDS